MGNFKGWTREAIAQKAQPKPASTPKRHAKADVLIGIDPGTKTGFAVKNFGVFTNVETKTIIEAILALHAIVSECNRSGRSILVRVEDARKRTFFGDSGSERWKGAGSIMRDCSIWEDELIRMGILFEFVHPKNVKATTAEQFKQLCGWDKRTSIHAREAAWLIL